VCSQYHLRERVGVILKELNGAHEPYNGEGLTHPLTQVVLML
jgi:hypothetical protein